MIHYTTEIDIAGIIVRDPITAITNLAIFAFGIGCYRRLRKEDIEFPNKNWTFFFLLVALSSLIGTIVHGFSSYTSPEVHFHIWWLMCVLQGAGITFAQLGVGNCVFPQNKSLVGIFVLIQFVAFAILLYTTRSFGVTKVHVALGLIPIMIYYVFQGMKGQKAEILVATGIGISALTAVVHSLKISLNEWFNYNDISHLLIITSIVFMYRGVKSGLSEPRLA